MGQNMPLWWRDLAVTTGLIVKLGIATMPSLTLGAFWCDVVESTRHHVGGVLARNALSKSAPEEPIKQIQKVEHFKEH